MTIARICVELKTSAGNAPALLEKVVAAVKEFEDSLVCPSISPIGDLRCMLRSDHDGDRHCNGIESWPREPEIMEGLVVRHRNKPTYRYTVESVTDTHAVLSYGKGSSVDLTWPVERAGFWKKYQLA